MTKVYSAQQLRSAIIRSLRKQGYSVKRGVIHMPKDLSKDDYRALHELAVKNKLEQSRAALKQYEDYLLAKYIANGWEVEPRKIMPKLVLVKSGSEHELLFRYACLNWRIPVSSGYGRRLRFLVLDESNGKLIGIFGLGDPVYAMKARDNWIGWEKKCKAKQLYHIMDAYVLGSIPPYSLLLGGKLVAMLVCSNEVRNAFRKKYAGRESLIRKQTRPPYLALVTTTSALGRSSVYNRIRIDGQQYWTGVGFTQGSGEFHFCNGVYDRMRDYVEKYCEPTAKHHAWGNGFRNKREIIKKCLLRIGLSRNLIYHGIYREIFVAPLGRNGVRFLRGETSRPCFYDWSTRDLSGLFLERWLMGRADRMPEYREYNREEFRVWKGRH